jgi:2,3-bisphosphoglycerate-dependent phosphoglycerate mutase
MTKLILMRHGQSVWNQKNLFTGWVDIPLTELGIQEAIEGGKKIRDIPIDVAFTSSLVRAHTTLTLSLLHHHSKKFPVFLHDDPMTQIHSEETKKDTIPVFQSWHLNERCYGELQGFNKEETKKKYGEEQVRIWRRSFDVAPPKGESLEMTMERTLPYFKEKIVPHLEAGQNVYVCAHGNSLRSIVMFIENLSREEVFHLELATGVPVIYEYKRGTWTKSC